MSILYVSIYAPLCIVQIKWRDSSKIHMQKEGQTKARKGDSGRDYFVRWKEGTTDIGKSIRNKNEKILINQSR